MVHFAIRRSIQTAPVVLCLKFHAKWNRIELAGVIREGLVLYKPSVRYFFRVVAIENVEVVRKATVLFSDEAFHVGVVLELTARKGRVTGSDDSNKSVPIHHTPDALCRYWSWNWCWQKCWHARWHT